MGFRVRSFHIYNQFNDFKNSLLVAFRVSTSQSLRPNK
nr:MAG TPA: hypothetical protein [Bacteriophage sp.]